MEILIVYLLMLIIPIIANVNINSTYSKYKKKQNVAGKTGYDVAREILDRNGLGDIYVVETRGNLTDCYDSSRKTVKLSTDIYHGDSIAAISVAAHECGHAVQDKEGYSWMRIRSAIFPVVSIGTNLAYLILIGGLLFQLLDLIYIAIVLTGLGLLFQLVTLPVEFDASNRAKVFLKEYGVVDNSEEQGVSKMLGSAAMTYVAGVVSAALEMLYLIMRFTDRN